MTKAEVYDLVNSYYPDPVFTKWTPSEYDMKYRFNTPRRMKKLSAVEEVENAKLKEVYNAALTAKKAVLKTIDDIEKYPAEVSTLFLSTFVRTIEYLKRCHDEYVDISQKISQFESGRAIACALQYPMTHVSRDPYTRRRTSQMVHLDADAWKKFAESYRGEFKQDESGEYNYTKPALKIENPTEFMDLVIKYYAAKDRDDVTKYGVIAYERAIRHMSDNLRDIIASIEKCFGGHVPTQCLTDASWGNKGEFCGVLTDGVKKISFKSFGAGGYNIQRYHFRFKITELKH